MDLRGNALTAIALIAVLWIAPAAAEEHDEASAGQKNWGKAGYDGGFKFESADGNFTLGIENRVQVRFYYVEPEEGESVGNFLIPRYKFVLKGTAFKDWEYKLQSDLAGKILGEVTGLKLEDASFTYTRQRWANIWLGQYKAFFGRQFLTSSGSQQFVDRSIASGRFSAVRQIGLGVTGTDANGRFEYNVGVFNGNGPNRLRNDNGSFQTVARVVWTPFGAFKPVESSFDYPDSPRLALGAAVNRNKITLLDDAGENVEEEYAFTRLGLEGAFKLRGINLVAEYFDEDQSRSDGFQGDASGYYVQLAYLLPNRHLELAGRYSRVNPAESLSDEESTETRLGASWYFNQHDYKLQADVAEVSFANLPADDSHDFRAQMQFKF